MKEKNTKVNLEKQIETLREDLYYADSWEQAVQISGEIRALSKQLKQETTN